MTPTDPNEPLPTTPVGATPAGPAAPEPPRWGAPPPPPPSWGPPGPPPGGGWGPQPPSMSPPPPPRRDRLALGIVLFIFGGLFLVFFGFLLLAYSAVRGEGPALTSGPRIGIIEVKGQIGTGAQGVDADRTMKQIRRFAQDDGLKAVVVRVDSPGGAVGPSQEIYDELRKLAAKKVVVCSMGGYAASGGLYISMACPKIVAESGTLTGSIGVISMFPNVKGLADKIGVRVETVKTGAFKDAGNPFRDMTDQDRAYWQGLIEDTLVQFVKAVADGRKMDEKKVRAIADGRALTGAQAKELGLVDQLGNFYDAIDLAKAEAKLSGEPNLVYPPDEKGRFLEQLLGNAASTMADAVATRLEQRASAAQQPGVYFLAR
jgi:protease IV